MWGKINKLCWENENQCEVIVDSPLNNSGEVAKLRGAISFGNCSKFTHFLPFLLTSSLCLLVLAMLFCLCTVEQSFAVPSNTPHLPVPPVASSDSRRN